MELREVVLSRRMVRSYDPDREVELEVVNIILKQAIRAPSAGHTLGRRFLVLHDITSRSLYWSTTAHDPPDGWLTRMRQAPVLIVCFADRQAYVDRYAEPDKARSSMVALGDTDWAIPYWHVDTGMSAMILLLAAHDVGLGACFFGVPPDRWAALAQAFHVPAGLAPVGVVSLGYPAPGPRSAALRRGTRPFAETVAFERF